MPRKPHVKKSGPEREVISRESVVLHTQSYRSRRMSRPKSDDTESEFENEEHKDNALVDAVKANEEKLAKLLSGNGSAAASESDAGIASEKVTRGFRWEKEVHIEGLS